MGILDSLTNLSPEQTQGLLAFAANTLQGANTGRPMSFGGALGGGIQAYQQNMDAQRKKKIEDEQAAQAAQLHALQIQGLTGELGDKETGRQQQLAAQKWLQEYNSSQISPTASAQRSLGSNMAPTQENADMLKASAAVSASSPQQSIYDRQLAQAQAMRSSGNPLLIAQADALEKSALAARPKYSNDFRTALGPDGKLHNYVLNDNGEFKDTGLGVAPKIRELGLGGTTQLIDDNTVTPGQVFKRTMTPGESANAAQSAARLAFDKSQAEDGTGPLNQDAILNAAKRYNFDGTLPPMGMGKSAAAGRSMILNKAAELAGDTGSAGGRDSQLSNKGDLASQSAAVKAFNSGKQGNTVRSFNVGISHLDTLDQLAGQLGNTSTPAFNKVANFYQQQTGNAAPTSFNAAKKIVGDEIVKAIVGAGGGVADREEAAKTIDAANSPAQLKSVIKTYQELMVGQLGGLEQQYRTSTKRNDFHTLLSDRAKEIYQSHGAGDAPTSAKIATLADIAETARASGRSTAEVTAALRAKGYKIGGQ